MINFFRKIRQHLLSKNRFSKYLVYAIGEILLVMIGILLALQVNNWNQSRLDNKEESNYLNRMSEDIKGDIQYLGVEIENAKLEIDSLGIFLNRMHENQKSHLEFIKLLNLANWNPRNIIIQDETFMEMTNSGKFDLIKSNELKSAILDYYKTKEFAYEHLETTVDHGFSMVINLLPELSRYYNYQELKGFNIFYEDEWGWINNYKDERFKILEGAISHFRYKAGLTRSYFEALYQKANLILTLIND